MKTKQATSGTSAATDKLTEQAHILPCYYSKLRHYHKYYVRYYFSHVIPVGQKLQTLQHTLGSDENERDLVHAPVLRHLDVVVVDGVETGLVLQAEHEDDGVHPGRELKR